MSDKLQFVDEPGRKFDNLKLAGHPLQHQNLPLVLRFMIDEMVQYPTQTSLVCFPTAFKKDAFKIGIVEWRQGLMRLFPKFLDLTQAELGGITLVRKTLWIFQHIPIRRTTDLVSHLLSGDHTLHPMPLRFANMQDERAYRMGAGDCRTSDVIVGHSLHGFAELFPHLFHSAQVETDLSSETRN